MGDLRGGSHDVRLVVLGLNPGRGYSELQGAEGIWTRRIADLGYSSCFQRSPAEDADAWIALHGKQSPYWRNLLKFGGRWFGHDTSLDVHSILNFELYPWHSDGVTAPMLPPAQILDQYVWRPCAEVATATVLAFGAPWFALCNALDLPEAGRWGADGTSIPLNDAKGWRVRAYRLPSGQIVAVSAQPGYAGPPGPERTAILHELLSSVIAG